MRIKQFSGRALSALRNYSELARNWTIEKFSFFTRPRELLQTERAAREQAEALLEVAAALDPGLASAQMLELILDQLAHVVEYDSASILLLDPDTRAMALTAQRGVRALASFMALPFQSLAHVQEVLTGRRPVIIQDTAIDPRWQPIDDPEANPIRCWLGAPLAAKESVIGVLNLDKEQPNYYTERHARLAAAFANQAAASIENSRLYRALAQETQRLELLNQLSRDLSARLDLEQVYASIYRATAQLMPCDVFMITLLVESGAEIKLAYLIDEGVHWPVKLFSAHLGLNGQVIATGKPLRIDNAGQFLPPGGEVRVGGLKRAVSLLMTPMTLGDKVIGALSAQSYQEHRYTDVEMQTLGALACQAAIAIENARLYAETQRQLQEQTLLSECSQALALVHDAESVLATVAERIIARFEATAVVYWAYDEAAGIARVEYEHWGVRAAGPELRSALGQRILLADFPLILTAIRSRQPQPIHLNDPRLSAAERSALSATASDAVAIAPLVWRDTLMGFFEARNVWIEDPPDAEDKRLLLALATEAAIALENTTLYAETKRKSVELTTLLEVAKAVSSAQKLDEVIRQLTIQMTTATNAAGCAVLKWDEASNSVITWMRWQQRQLEFAAPPGAAYPLSDYPTTREVLEQKQIKYMTLAEAVAASSEAARLENAGFTGMLLLPLTIGERVIGLVEVFEDALTRKFAADEINLLQGMANQAAVAIANAQLFDALAQEKRRLELLYDLSLSLATTLDPKEVASRALEQICFAFEAFQGAIYLVYPESSKLRLIALTGANAERVERLNQTVDFRVDRGLSGWVARERRPIIVDDVSHDARWVSISDLDEQVRSAIASPLIVGNTLVGVINLSSTRLAAFQTEQILLLSAAATAVAVALQNARLFEETRRQANEVTAASGILNVLNASPDVTKAFSAIAAGLKLITGCERVSLALLDASREQVTLAALDQPRPELDRGARFAVADTAAGQDVLAGRIHLTPELAAEASFPIEKLLLERGYRSRINFPLRVGEQIIGAVNLVWADPAGYHRLNLTLLSQIADAVALAIEKNRFFEAEREQRALAEALRDTVSALNSTLNFDEVLDRILDNVGRVAPHDAATIMMVDEERNEAYVVRGRGYTERGFAPHQLHWPVSLDKPSNLVTIRRNGQPCIINDVGAFADWMDFPPAAWVRSYLGAPIHVRGQVIGFINLNSASSGFFTPTQAEHLQAFADEAAVAIENARLFAATKKHGRNATLLNEITRAALEASNLTDGLQMLADRLGQLMKTDECYITLWDESRQQPAPGAAAGARPERYPAKSAASLPGEVILTRSILQAGRTLIIDIDPTNPSLRRNFPEVYEEYPWHSLLGLPLIVGEQKLGAVLLCFNQPRRFAPEEIALSEQAAGQIAMAVFKARLLEAEREQRLLAEALRDTAEALNSTLNFDDVLELILANVGRVAPYDSASLMLAEDPSKGIDAQTGVVRIVRTRGYAERGLEAWAQSHRFRVADSPNMQKMIQTRRPVVNAETATDPNWRPLPETGWVQSYLGAPIGVKGWIIGFINLDSTAPGFFTPVHADRLHVFTDQAAVAIENAYLYDSIRQNAEELAILYRASAQLIHPGAELETLADQIVTIVTTEFNVAHCGLLLLDDSKNRLKLLAQSGDLRVASPPTLPVDGPGLIAEAARAGEIVYAPDVRQDPRYLDAYGVTRSELAAPLKAGNRVIGVLNLESPETGAFDSRAQRMIIAFAERAGLALENTQLLARLDLARRAAEEASQLKSEFLANTSHELRTPLTGIIGSLSMVMDNLCDTVEEEHEFIQIAYSASEHLLDIINNVLDIAKIEAGRMDVEPQAFNLSALFSDLYSLSRVQAEDKKLRFEMRLPEPEAPLVWADPDKVRQILLNLIGNALKFTEQGEITVRAEPEEKWMRIMVRDTGIGIPPEKQARLFQPFVQADGSMTRKYGGTGLGLSISRRLAEMMGGSLALYSEGEGRGTILTLRIPLHI